jgi:CxxC motif-containing protein (DUF1111 family)
LLLTCSPVVLAADSESGSTVFHTRWFATNEAQPQAFSGLGPLFNAVSCAACHGTGGGSISSIESGTVPTALVVQLESPQPDANIDSQPQGDPVYGRVFSAAALSGVKAEGTVLVQYTQMIGHYYPDGIRWRLRIPEYRFANLAHGPIASTTIIKPRLAPSFVRDGATGVGCTWKHRQQPWASRPLWLANERRIDSGSVGESARARDGHHFNRIQAR